LRENFTFTNKDGININVYKWTPAGKIKGVIQVAHGMSEKALRYGYLADKLTEAGFVVYANDHRGHGKSAGSLLELGYISDKDGFQDMVDDMRQLTAIIMMENPQSKIILLGHSMGSFLTQRYIQLYGKDLSGVILSGTNGKQKPTINLGILLSKAIMTFKDRRYKSKLIDNLAFGSYNKKIKPALTKFDWLSRDKEEVKKYIDDPYCGTIFPVSFFYDLFNGMKTIHKEEYLKLIPKDLPIYIFGGNADPVGNYGDGIINLYKTYKSQSIKTLSYKLYTGGRHEMFNELNKDEVIKDTIEWMVQVL
jgi:alpha-beta hydrolase superfamily lysophospholipase